MGRELRFALEVSDDGTAVFKNAGKAIEEIGKHSETAKGKLHTLGMSIGDLQGKFKSLIDTVFSLKNLLISFVGALGIGLTIKSFIEASSASEGYRVRLEVLLGSVREGSRLFNAMAEYAAKVPFTYQQIMAAATNLSGVLKGGVDQIRAWMPMVGDLAAASGLTIEQTTQQVIRMYSAGAGSADLFRERGVLAMMGFQAGVTYSTQETIEKMISAWNAADSKFKGVANKLGKTWAGLISMLQDRWFMFRNMVMDQGIFDSMKTGLDGIIKKIDELNKSGALEKFALTLADNLFASIEVIVKTKMAAADFFNWVSSPSRWLEGGANIDFSKSPVISWVNEARKNITSKLSINQDNRTFSMLSEMGLGYNGLAAQAMGYENKVENITPQIIKAEEAVHKLTDAEKASIKALEEVNDIIAKNTLTPYHLAVYELDKTFKGLRETLGDTPEIMQAYGLELDALKVKFADTFKSALYAQVFDNSVFGKALKDARDYGQSIKLGNLGLGNLPPSQGQWANLGFGGFSTTLNANTTMMAADAAERAVKLSQEQFDGLQKELEENYKYFSELQVKQAEKSRKIWDDAANSLDSSFTSAFDNIYKDGLKAFGDLGKNGADILFHAINQQMLAKPLESLTNGITDLFTSKQSITGYGMFGEPIIGTTKGALAGAAPYIGAGAMGYGMGGIGGALGGIGGYTGGAALAAGGGTLAGSALAGPVGMIGGIVLGSLAQSLFESKPPKPHIELVYEAIDGQIELISESFKHTSKNQELLDTVGKSLQSQIDFYSRIAELTSGAMADLSVNLSGKNQFDILMGISKNSFEMMTSGYSDISKMIPGFKEDFSELWGKTWSDLTPGSISKTIWGKNANPEWGNSPEIKGSYPDEILNQIMNETNQQKKLDILKNWLESSIGILSTESIWTEPGGTFNLTSFVGKNISDFLSQSDLAAWDEYFNKISEKFFTIQSDIAQMVGNAFLDSIDTTEMQGFGDTLEKLMYDKVKLGLAQVFTNQALDVIMQGDTGFAGAFGLLGQLSAGEGGVTLTDVTEAFQSSFGQMGTILEQISPIFEIFSTGMKQLSESLGLNTTATQSNTDAVLGPVNSFLMSLDTGPLAPSMSMAGLSDMQNKLYTSAFADPSKFSEYANFMTSSWLPQMQGVSSDYAGDVAGVRSQVEALPWYSGNNSATDIGTAVAAAVGPMLLDIKESANITVNITVDGKEIKSAVVSSLNDPDVVNKMRSRV